MVQKIGLVDEGLAEALARASSEARRCALAAGIRLALERTGLTDQRLDAADEALSAGRLGSGAERSAVLALVEELDEAAWDIQDRVEAGTADQSDYRSLRHALPRPSGSPSNATPAWPASDGLYEAFHTVGDLTSLRRVVIGALGAVGGDA